MNKRRIDLSDAISPEGIKKLEKGNLLRFKKDKQINEYVITHVNKKSHKVFARQTYTLTPDEFEDMLLRHEQ